MVTLKQNFVLLWVLTNTNQHDSATNPQYIYQYKVDVEKIQ